MTSHYFTGRAGVGAVNFHASHLIAGGQPVHLFDGKLQPLLIVVGKGDRLHSLATGHIVCCGTAHHAGSNNKNFHEYLPE
jgi:hypothetical protein